MHHSISRTINLVTSLLGIHRNMGKYRPCINLDSYILNPNKRIITRCNLRRIQSSILKIFCFENGRCLMQPFGYKEGEVPPSERN